MKPKLFILCLLIAAQALAGEIVIIHEKNVSGEWVLDVTLLEDDANVAAVLEAIEADPAKRLGRNPYILGGIRLTIEQLPDTTETNIEETPSAGEVLVAWVPATNGVPNANPADYTVEMLPSLDKAEAFINNVMKDPNRVIWDNRPFLVDRKYTVTETTIAGAWRLVMP